MSSLKEQFDGALDHDHMREPLDKSAATTLKTLFNEHPDIDTFQKAGISLDRILAAAALVDNVPMIETCLKAGAPVTETVAAKAHAGCGFKAYRLLVTAGLDVNLHFSYSGTPLGKAILAEDPEFVRFLLEAGANPDTHCFASRTPIELIIIEHFPLPLAKLVAGYSAEFPYKGLLLEAVIHKYPEMIEYLIQNGSSPNETVEGCQSIYEDDDMWTALHLAARGGDDTIIKMLLLHGADKSIKDSDGKTAYDLAVAKGHPNGAELLTVD